MNTTARKNCVNFWNKMAESCLTSPPPPSALLCPWNLFSILLQPRSARPAKAAFNRKERRKKVGNAMGPASPGRELHFERIRIRRVGWSTRPPSWQTAEEFHFDSRPPQLLAAVSFVVKSDLIRIWSTPFPSLSLSLSPSLPPFGSAFALSKLRGTRPRRIRIRSQSAAPRGTDRKSRVGAIIFVAFKTPLHSYYTVGHAIRRKEDREKGKNRNE